jgi:hypothetical protein
MSYKPFNKMTKKELIEELEYLYEIYLNYGEEEE